MRKCIMVAATLLYSLVLSAAPAVKVRFVEGSLYTVREQAALEGKPYFVQFTAGWCAPCKAMEEGTYTNQQLADYVNTNYLALKIDVDDFDGIVYKQQYNVQVLPTLLFFDANNKLLGKYEGGLSADKMLSLLKGFYTPGKPVTPTPPATAPGKPATTASSSPVTVPAQPAASATPSAGVTRPPLKPAASAPKPIPAAYEKPVASAAATAGYYQVSTKPIPAAGYAIQVGVFSEYNNLLKESAQLEADYQQPVLVQTIQLNGKPAYKILVGRFEQRQEADAFLQQMRNKGKDGLVRAL